MDDDWKIVPVPLGVDWTLIYFTFHIVCLVLCADVVVHISFITHIIVEIVVLDSRMQLVNYIGFGCSFLKS